MRSEHERFALLVVMEEDVDLTPREAAVVCAARGDRLSLAFDGRLECALLLVTSMMYALLSDTFAVRRGARDSDGNMKFPSLAQSEGTMLELPGPILGPFILGKGGRPCFSSRVVACASYAQIDLSARACVCAAELSSLGGAWGGESVCAFQAGLGSC